MKEIGNIVKHCLALKKPLFFIIAYDHHTAFTSRWITPSQLFPWGTKNMFLFLPWMFYSLIISILPNVLLQLFLQGICLLMHWWISRMKSYLCKESEEGMGLSTTADSYRYENFQTPWVFVRGRFEIDFLFARTKQAATYWPKAGKNNIWFQGWYYTDHHQIWFK